MAPEPIDVEVDVLEPQDPAADEALAGGARPLFGYARERAPRPPRELPGWLIDLGVGVRTRWTALDSRRRRFTKIAAVAAALLALGATITLARPGPVRPSAATHGPTVVHAPIAAPPYNPNTDTVSAVGPAIPVPGGPVRDISIASSDMYVLSAGAISVVDTYTRTVLRHADYTSDPSDSIVLDLADGTLWVVNIGVVPSYAREFDMVSLKPLRTVQVQGMVFDAAELDEQLYLATSGGVFTVVPGSSALTSVGSITPEPEALAVDPMGGTVLALGSGTGARILTITDNGATVRVGPTLNIETPTIATVNKALWAAGVDPDARLLRLDPSTLRPLPEAAGGVVIAEGTDSQLKITAGVADLWVLSRSQQQLMCVDSTSGNVLQRWSGITQSVATGGSGPDAVTNGRIVPLVLRGNCLG